MRMYEDPKMEMEINERWVVHNSIIKGYATIGVEDSPRTIITQSLRMEVAQHLVDIHNQWFDNK